MGWTQELKDEVIERYQAANPTPETSMEIVTDLAEEFEQSPNGVRSILSRAGVYVKKESPSKAGSGGGGTRVSKAAAHDALRGAIESIGGTVEDEIITKLTGKAAQYLASVINNSQSD